MAIADDIVGHAHIAYLGDPFEQYCGLNGKPLIGGWIEVFQAGTDTKYITMQNFDGAMNPFKVPLNADGRVVMLADPSLTYDIYVRNSYGDLVCSRLNAECTCPGDISISGVDTYIRNTDGTLDVSLQTSSDNRRVYTVNTHNKVLDVQSPLYFAENSNTATVIGFSGDNYVQKDYLNEYVASSISGKMDESKLEYNSNGKITAYDGSAFAGQGGAGDPDVSDLVHANSATWNDVSAKLDTTAYATASSTFLTAIPDDYATKDYVQSSVSSKLESSVFATVSGNFLTAHQSLDGLMSASLLGMSGNTITSYNNKPFPIGGEGDAEVNQIVHTNSATWNSVSDKLDTTAFSNVSSTFLTAHQDISNLMSKSESANFYPMSGNPSGFLTSIPNTYLQNTDLATTDGKVTAISGIPLSAGGGESDAEVNQIVHANSAAWNNVSDKLDTTAFSTVSGDFLTAHQDLSDYLTKASADTLYQPIGNYADATALDGKVDTSSFTAFSSTTIEKIECISGAISGTYELSAGNGIDITDYPNEQKTVISVTAQGGNQEVENLVTAQSATWNSVSDKLDTTAFSDVSGSFLTAVPAGTMNESAFEYDASDNITAYNGSAFKAGDEFPQSATEAIETVTANSADWNGTTDTVSSNSGTWGGSALPISAGPGIKFEMVDNTLVASTDGYVWQSASLFHTDTPVTQTTYTLSDNCSNYDKLDVDFYDINNWRTVMECSIPSNLDASGTRGGYFSVVPASTATGAKIWLKAFNWTATNTTWSCYCSEIAAQGGSTTQTVNANNPDNSPKVVNIIGWKRVGGK